MSDELPKMAVHNIAEPFPRQLKAGAQWAVIKLAQALIFFGGLYVGFKILALVVVLLAGDPAQIRQGAQAGAVALEYIRKAIAAEYLPQDDQRGNLPPKLKPSPSHAAAPSSSPEPKK